MNGLWEHYKGTMVGLGIGVFLGIIYLIFGFWDMLVFAFLVAVGGHIGHKIDRGEDVLPLKELSHWLSERWNLFR
ncbi:MAG TPA: DUF2273 domain-containing protein [Bacilli bacterium]